MIQEEGKPAHYLESEGSVFVLSREDLVRLVTAQRKACADYIRAEDETGQMMSMREDIWTSVARCRILEAPLVDHLVEDLTYSG